MRYAKVMPDIHQVCGHLKSRNAEGRQYRGRKDMEEVGMSCREHAGQVGNAGRVGLWEYHEHRIVLRCIIVVVVFYWQTT